MDLFCVVCGLCVEYVANVFVGEGGKKGKLKSSGDVCKYTRFYLFM